MVLLLGMMFCVVDWYDICFDCEVSGCVKCRMFDDEMFLYDIDVGGKSGVGWLF